jgi:spermidine synthase
MSMGFLPPEMTETSKGELATVLRGRDTARVAIQLALGTQWASEDKGDIDVLVMDIAPGYR